MTEIKIAEYVFSVDVDKTQEYYNKQTLCECDCCQYYHSNIKGKFPKLEAFLEKFGVDIEKPDETFPVELDGEYMYINVGYTVCGEIKKTSEHEIIINDNVSIFVDSGYAFPNEQKENYFSFSVSGISLPCDTAKEQNKDSFFDKIKNKLFNNEKNPF